MKFPVFQIVLGLATLLLAPPAQAAKQLYTCGMHPQIIRDEPGDCPICGMKLQPILDGAAATAGGAAIRIDAATVQRMNLKTALVRRGPVRREIRTVGTVAYDEAGLRDITTKYEGWLERVFVDGVGDAVRAGEPLFDIYSPDLLAAEQNYLVARRTEEDGGPLTLAAERRLQLLDIPAGEIAALARDGEASRTRMFPAPVDGVVAEKMGVAGQMVKPGERIYRLADLSTVWVVAQIYESDLPFVHEGQEVAVRTTYGNPREYAGRIGRLLPQVDELTRAAAVRIVVANGDGSLRPGMFADVRLAAQLADSAVLVPEPAVLRSGERNTVFVAKEGGMFEPREVRLGARSAGGDYEVRAGLAEGERIVTSGQFLLDSESQLRDAIQRMTQGDAASRPELAPKPPEPPAAASAAPATPVLYTCPMEEHADVVSDRPGECPKCGMDLVPTGEVAHGRQAEARWREQHPGSQSAPTPEPASHHHGN